MTEKFFAERLYDAGFTDLVSVIPPGAQLVPSSKIPQSQVGKIPGVRTSSGLWAGYGWRKHTPTLEDVRQWSLAGANVGLRADRFIGVYIDIMDSHVAQIVEEAALAHLGDAPIRIGRAPKRLLLYRAAEPMGRMRLWVQKGDATHLVEVLGTGQQFLVHGTHPTTGRAYEWLTDPAAIGAEGLTAITRADVDRFLTELVRLLEMLGVGRVEREGDGKPITRAEHLDQQNLLAPSLELLGDAVRMIPNTDELFGERTAYLTMGYAIKAAAGPEHEDEGFQLFAWWADQWPGNYKHPAGNDPTTVREDWRRMNGAKSVGWSWLAEQARAFGFEDAGLDFDAEGEAPEEVVPGTGDTMPAAPLHSDQWLADKVVEQARGVLRYVPARGQYLAWELGTWAPDSDLLAEDVIKRELRRIAVDLEKRGVTPKEQKEYADLARAICSSGKVSAVASLVKSDRGIAVPIESLDHDPMALNTPAGIVDLTTGALRPSDPDALCTKRTAVPADFGGAHSEWSRFLEEVTAGDAALVAYLQRLAGYCLTGLTIEQQLTFIHGDGGNGKGVFVNVLSGILGDYARTTPMETFTEAQGERHTTELAMLHGARLVTASETEAGKRWAEARIKSMTGGDAITARFMRQDNFTFRPQCKLVFMGNHRPEMRNIDAAMRRRIQLVPFTVKPRIVDKALPDKLRAEWPAILAWMVAGCLAWQGGGLQPPAAVREATDEYFEDEDAIGRWMREALEPVEGERALSQELFQSWQEWANANKEWVGSLKRLVSALKGRGLERWQDTKTRRKGFVGFRVRDRQDLGIEE